MEAGHARTGLPHLPPPRHSNQNSQSPGAPQYNDSPVTPCQYDGFPLTQQTAAVYAGSHRALTATDASANSTTPSYIALSSSQPMVSINTNHSIDQEPSFLTESKVDAMNAVELQFYKKKDDLAKLMKILHKINAEAPL
ncbi:hypothetical protein DFH28DRAFT_1123096 [Melampsora americana]|nr:hypothetical protein DFH28DRAFT_1123096 [Melampsora americana]